MTTTTTPAAVVTADGRAHRKADCKRAAGKAFAAYEPTRPETVTACSYCKPNEGTVEVAVELMDLTRAARQAPPVTLDDFEAYCAEQEQANPSEFGDAESGLVVPSYMGDGVGDGDDDYGVGPLDHDTDVLGPIDDEPPVGIVIAGRMTPAPEVVEHDDAEPAVIDEAVQPDAPADGLPAVTDVLTDHVAEARMAQLHDDAVQLREQGHTFAEIATQLDLPAKLVSHRLAGQPRGKKATTRATSAPAATTPATPAVKRPRKDLPPITDEVMDKLVAGRKAGQSYRQLRDAFPELQRAHSSLRAILVSSGRVSA